MSQLSAADLVTYAQSVGKGVAQIDPLPPAGARTRAILSQLGDSGLLQQLFPPSAGGNADGPLSVTRLCHIRQGLARETALGEVALSVQVLGSHPILLGGSNELIDAYVRPAAQGKAIAAFALTEPDAGSDVAAISLKATPTSSGYRLTGTKTFISNAPDADFYTVFARTGAGRRAITAFVVPAAAEGLSGAPIPLITDVPVGTIQFDDVYVRRTQMIGEPGAGFGIAMQTLYVVRTGVGAMAVGMAEAAQQLAISRAGARRQFGATLYSLQTVAHRLAESDLLLQSARLMVYDAALSFDSGGSDLPVKAAMAKWYATEIAQRVIDAAIQIHGAAGLKAGDRLEKLYRDIRAARIYDGATEVLREVVARSLYAKR